MRNLYVYSLWAEPEGVYLQIHYRTSLDVCVSYVYYPNNQPARISNDGTAN
jgi:hypothetical protein